MTGNTLKSKALAGDSLAGKSVAGSQAAGKSLSGVRSSAFGSDELAKRPIRSPEDLKNAFRFYEDKRPLDRGETANMRLRLAGWARMLGADEPIVNQIEITSGASNPFFRVAVRTWYAAITPPSAPPAPRLEPPTDVIRVLCDPELEYRCGESLTATDYRVVAIIASDDLWDGFFDPIPHQKLKDAIAPMLLEARQAAGGDVHIVRQELILARAHVLEINYRVGRDDYWVCLVGNELRTVSTLTPFAPKAKEDLLRRAVSLLDTDQVPAGIKDLRACMEDPAKRPRALQLLTALRGKLATTYLANASHMLANMQWLESIVPTQRAALLAPNAAGVPEHYAQVAQRVRWLQMMPGIVIAVIFTAFAAINQWSPPFIAAAVVALTCGIVTASRFGMRMERTLSAFVHATLFPTAMACVIATAPTRFDRVIPDAVIVVLLGLIIFADIWVFRAFGKHIFRGPQLETLGADPESMLWQIQQFVQEDWDTLNPEYVKMGPLSKFVGGRVLGKSDAAATPSA